MDETHTPKRTPGPWRRGQLGNPSVYGPDGQGEFSGLICRVIRTADIDLITAAPALLEALEPFAKALKTCERLGYDERPDSFVMIIGEDTITLGDLRRASAALKAAKGDDNG